MFLALPLDSFAFKVHLLISVPSSSHPASRRPLCVVRFVPVVWFQYALRIFCNYAFEHRLTTSLSRPPSGFVDGLGELPNAVEVFGNSRQKDVFAESDAEIELFAVDCDDERLATGCDRFFEQPIVAFLVGRADQPITFANQDVPDDE